MGGGQDPGEEPLLGEGKDIRGDRDGKTGLGEEPEFNTTRFKMPEWKLVCNALIQTMKNGGTFGEADQVNINSDGVLSLLELVLGSIERAVDEEPASRSFSKIPLASFEDPSPNGGLHLFVLEILKLLKETKAATLDDLAPHLSAAKVSELETNIEKALKSGGKLKCPKVFISPEVKDGEAVHLKQVISKLGGSIVPSAAFPGVTHIVNPLEEVSGTEQPRAGSKRIVKQSNGEALVHFVGHPSSRDRVIALDDSKGPYLSKTPAPSIWQVSPLWVTKSERYCEWMDERDFTTAAVKSTEENVATAKASGEKRPLDDAGADAPETKREKPSTADDSAPSKGDGAITKPGPVPEIDIQPKGPVEGDDVSTPTLISKPAKETNGEGAAGEAKKDNVANGNAAPDPPPSEPKTPELRQLHCVPAHAAWFRWDHIHEIEKGSLPEFFNGKSGSKTPKIYKEYRDFIIDKFREEPTRKLTFTACRKFLSGDVNAIYRVFALLEHWGLINFDLESMNREEAFDVSSGCPKPVSVAMPSALRMVKQPDRSKDKLVKLGSGVHPLSLLARKNQYGHSAAEPAGSQLKFVCNITGKDCTQVRFHCTKIPDYDLSPESYEECKAQSKFPSGITAEDFIRLDGTSSDKQGDPNRWSNEETLLLLEALESYGENWTEVAEYVGTKSQLQCIHHFLSLPIEDGFLDQLEDGQKAGDDGLNEDPIPFADTGNPVMAQVAFLATMVGPKVAAAAAQKALAVLYETEPYLVADAPKPDASVPNGGAAEAEAPEAQGNTTATPSAAPAPGSQTLTPPSSAAVKAAAATGLAAAAVKAKLLADKEEQDIQKLVIQVIEKKMLIIEQKMKKFEELDALLEQEKEDLAKARVQLAAEKVALRLKESTKKDATPSAAPAQPTQPAATAPAPVPTSPPEPVPETKQQDATPAPPSEAKPAEETPATPEDTPMEDARPDGPAPKEASTPPPATIGPSSGETPAPAPEAETTPPSGPTPSVAPSTTVAPATVKEEVSAPPTEEPVSAPPPAPAEETTNAPVTGEDTLMEEAKPAISLPEGTSAEAATEEPGSGDPEVDRKQQQGEETN